MTSATSATSEGAQGIFSKITFLKSVRSNKKDEVCHSYLVKIFTKSLHRGGVDNKRQLKLEDYFKFLWPSQNIHCTFTLNSRMILLSFSLFSNAHLFQILHYWSLVILINTTQKESNYLVQRENLYIIELIFDINFHIFMQFKVSKLSNIIMKSAYYIF